MHDEGRNNMKIDVQLTLEPLIVSVEYLHIYLGRYI